jgi:hypothetical protein
MWTTKFVSIVFPFILISLWRTINYHRKSTIKHCVFIILTIYISKLLLQTTRGNVCSRKREIGMVCFWFQNNEIEIFVWLRMKKINRKFSWYHMYSECRPCILVSCVNLLFVLGRRLSIVIHVTDGSIVPAILVSQRFISLVINFSKSFFLSDDTMLIQ